MSLALEYFFDVEEEAPGEDEELANLNITAGLDKCTCLIAFFAFLCSRM